MQVFITGVSKGLGKALAEYFINNGDTVVGIGRSHSFKSEKFSFLKCDLQNIEEVQNLQLEITDKNVLLINNAGIIGEVKRISDQIESDIVSVLNVNTIAPMLLCQQLLSKINSNNNLSIVNISSGAASRPIPSWASYCSSKAAIEMFSEAIYLEEKEKGNTTKVYSVSPGVIDTSMQEKIRSVDPSNFSSLNNFQELKNSGQLVSPDMVAKKLIRLLEMEYDEQVVYSLRDL